MKKILILLLTIVFVSSMAFIGIGCKEEIAEAVTEAVEEAEEEVVMWVLKKLRRNSVSMHI